MKISDFGTSQQYSEHSTKMSFAGTVAWMAPEIIRNEPCSEKVDIWSFGVCLWELLVCEIPYKNVDSSAIIWGVGNYTMQLPIPGSCPEGFQLLIKQCWSVKPRNRPSFQHILRHLSIACQEIKDLKDEDYFSKQQSWKAEVWEYNEKMKCEGSREPLADEALVKKRKEELKHAQDVRDLYQDKLARTTNLYLELNAEKMRIEQREKELQRREQMVEKSYSSSKKKLRPTVRIHKKPEISFIRTSSPLRSTSPDSPTHLGAAARPAHHQRQHHVHAHEPRRLETQYPQYHPTAEKMQQKKTHRHKRTGSHGSGANITPRSSPKASHSSEATTQTDPLLDDTLDATGSDYFSMSRQTSGRRSDKSFSSFNSQCVCPGCPSNILKAHAEEDDDEVDPLATEEDHLDDLEKKASEMINKDSSRRSSYNIVPDDNDDIDDSSSECVLESSIDELDRNWTDDDDVDVIRRHSLLRRPVRAKSRTSFVSLSLSRRVSVASSEEGEVSDYVASPSKRSTLESNASTEDIIRT